MSSNARLDPEVFTGSEHERELFHDRDPDSCALSLDDVYMITANGDDDAGTSVERPEIRARVDIELAVESPLYPKPADNNVAACGSGSCKQLTESHDTRSPSLESLESNLEHTVAAATGRKCLSSKNVADEVLGRSLIDGLSRTIGDAGTVGSRTCLVGSSRTGWTGRNC